MDHHTFHNLYINRISTEDFFMTDQEFTPIERQNLINKIEQLQEYYDIDMSADIIESNTLPTYYSVNQLNENTVRYEFELDEGSAEIIVYNFNSDFESYEGNEILESHINNRDNIDY